MKKVILTFSVLLTVVFALCLFSCSSETPVKYFGSKAPSELKAVGDIVFNDGSATPYDTNLQLTDQQKENAIAVIYYVGKTVSDSGNVRVLGLALSENTEGLQWCRWKSDTDKANGYNYVDSIASYVNNLTVTYGIKNGSLNFEKLKRNLRVLDKSDSEIEGNYPIFEYAEKFGKSDNSPTYGTDYEEGWYIPTIAEMIELYNANKSENLINNALVLCGAEGINNKQYYTSSQVNNMNPYAYKFNFEEGKFELSGKESKNSVRAIYDFSGTGKDDTDFIGFRTSSYTKSVGDVIFSDGSFTNSKNIKNVIDEYKTSAVAVIYYVGESSDLLGRKTLGLSLKFGDLAYCKDNANAHGTTNKNNKGYFPETYCILDEKTESDSIQWIGTPDMDGSDNFQAIADFLDSLSDGSNNLNDTGIPATNGNASSKSPEEAKELYPAFYTAMNGMEDFFGTTLHDTLKKGWYLPSYAELLALGENKSIIKDVIRKFNASACPSYLFTSSHRDVSSSVIVYILNGDGYDTKSTYGNGADSNSDVYKTMFIREFY